MFNVKTLSLLFLSAFMVGCANNPELRNQKKITKDNIEQITQDRANELSSIWGKNDPAITYFDRDKSVFIAQANAIDSKTLSKRIIDLRINEGSKLKDLTGILHPYGVTFVFSGNETIAEKPFSIRRFSGSLGELISIIETVHNITTVSAGPGVLKFTEKATFIASMPQNEEVLEAIENGISSLGAEDVKTNKLTGSVIYSASRSQQSLIESYIERFYESFAAVRMQVTVFSVSLDEQLSDGFNWGELDIVLGHVQAAHSASAVKQVLNSLSGNGQNQGSINTPGTSQPGQGVPGGQTGNNNGNNNGNTGNQPNLGYGTQFSGSNLNDIRGYSWLKPDGIMLGAHNNNISLGVVMNWLNQYGNTRAEQSAFLETITGKETVIRSQKKIPFISNESTTLVGNLSPVATQNTETSEKETGIKIEFTPYYDPSSQEITIDLLVQLKNLVGFTNLTSASGNQFRQPDIQEQDFPTTVRMKVGETKLLGGVVFETLIEQRSENNLMKFRGSDFIKQDLSKSAMFILIRPTVQLFRQPVEQNKVRPQG